MLQTMQKIYEEHERNGIHLLPWYADEYPSLLKEIQNAPYILFYKGDISIIKRNTISIVGTRNASNMGLYLCEFLSEYFSSKGFCIVSGMAKGIDTTAHETCLSHDSPTIAVVAHGLDRIYPSSNHHLFEHAKENGNLLLISEYPASMKPFRHHFIRRNRIISALSRKTLMVEGGIKSGALITCSYALDQGREVAAFVHETLINNQGAENLVSEGAENLADSIHLEIKNWYHSKESTLARLRGSHRFLGNGLWVRARVNREIIAA